MHQLSHSAALVLLLLLFLTSKHSAMIFLSAFIDFYALQHLSSQQLEHPTDVAIIFCAGLNETESILLGKSLCLLPWHLPILVEVCLRANKYHIRVRIAHLLDLVDPRLNVVETDGIGDGVSKYDAMRPLIKRFRDVSKALLACCIPNVQSDLSLVEFYPLDLEVHPNRAQVIRLEGVFTVPNQQASFAHSAVADHQVFEGHCSLRVHYYMSINCDWWVDFRLEKWETQAGGRLYKS